MGFVSGFVRFRQEAQASATENHPRAGRFGVGAIYRECSNGKQSLPLRRSLYPSEPCNAGNLLLAVESVGVKKSPDRAVDPATRLCCRFWHDGALVFAERR